MVGRAVDDGRLIQRNGDIFEILNINVDRNNIRAHRKDDVAIQMIDEVQVVHDFISGNLHCNAGKQCRESEKIADEAISRELETVQYVCDLRADDDGSGQNTDQDDSRIPESHSHVRFTECIGKIREIQPV